MALPWIPWIPVVVMVGVLAWMITDLEPDFAKRQLYLRGGFLNDRGGDISNVP